VLPNPLSARREPGPVWVRSEPFFNVPSLRGQQVPRALGGHPGLISPA
jgi:hypothetical protein